MTARKDRKECSHKGESDVVFIRVPRLVIGTHKAIVSGTGLSGALESTDGAVAGFFAVERKNDATHGSKQDRLQEKSKTRSKKKCKRQHALVCTYDNVFSTKRV